MLKKKIFFFVVSALFFAGNTGLAADQAKVNLNNPSTVKAAVKIFDSGNRAGAFLLLKNLEKSGNVRILSRLGWCYFSGAGVEENQPLALQYFKRSISDPDGFGLDGMGVCYQQGVGVKKDLAQAAKLHKKALAMGNLYAAGNLAMYYDSIGNNAEALRYWEMGYRSKLPPFWRALSAYMLGIKHTDPQKKIFWWENAAKDGCHDALLELTKFHNSGVTVEVNMPKALEYAKLYAERTGEKAPYADAAFDWAIEKLALQENETAKKYMLIAADNGEKRAYWYAFELSGNGKYALAAAESGDERGFAEAAVYLMDLQKENPQSAEEYMEKAEKYYKAAIELQDSNSLNALCNLAALYAQKDPAANMDKIVKLYQQAADWHFVRGLRSLGMLYAIYNSRASRDEEKKEYALAALQYLAAAAFAGDKSAAAYYAQFEPFAQKYSDSAEAIFFNGVKMLITAPSGTADPKLIARAMELIKKAADSGCLQAVMTMGVYLMDEAGNAKEAVQYLRLAASAGILEAKWRLASSEQLDEIVSGAEREKLLKELIAVGNFNSRNLYAQILKGEGKTAEAIKEFRAAAAKGHAGSMTLLHLLLVRQKDEKLKEEGWDLLSQAMTKHDGLAQCLAGLNSFDTTEIPPRFGMHLLMKGVIDSNGRQLSAFHMHIIAMNFAQGKGVARSAENARRIGEIMLDEGYAYGFYTMGQLYQKGVFGKVDLEKARSYYQAGAKEGVGQCIEALKNPPFSK